MTTQQEFLIETHDRSGVLIRRNWKTFEDNPAYGEAECQLILANEPDVYSVMILEAIPGEFLRGANGEPLLDGAGVARQAYMEKMKCFRTPPNPKDPEDKGYHLESSW